MQSTKNALADDPLTSLGAAPDPSAPARNTDEDSHCPACGAVLIHIKCKVICRSEKCVYRLIFNCSEF